MRDEERIGQFLINRVTGLELYRIVAVLEPGLVRCVYANGGGRAELVSRVYRRVEDCTYDEVQRTGVDGRWEFRWTPLNGKRIGRLRFASPSEAAELEALHERRLREKLLASVNVGHVT